MVDVDFLNLKVTLTFLIEKYKKLTTSRDFLLIKGNLFEICRLCREGGVLISVLLPLTLILILI